MRDDSKKIILITGRGAGLGHAFAEEQLVDVVAHKDDHQRPYLEAWLRFIGISEISAVIAEKTLLGAEPDIAARAEAKKQAEEVARRYADLSMR